MNRSIHQLTSRLSLLKRSAVNATFQQTARMNYTTDPFPFTNSLIKKNYLQYPAQSREEISHDYVYDEKERLPDLKTRLKDFVDPFDEISVNIGKMVSSSSLKEIKESLNKQVVENKANRSFEINAREMKIKIDAEKAILLNSQLTSMRNESKIARHYNIFKDLFQNGYFVPLVDLEVNFGGGGDNNNKDGGRVFYGNKMAASLCQSAPELKINDVLNYQASSKSSKPFQTLLFLNLDGNFKNSQNEALLWMIGNVENGAFEKGQELVAYQQPLPMRGSGWHRCAFVLFEHEKNIEFGDYLSKALRMDGPVAKSGGDQQQRLLRDFKCSDFYLQFADRLMPIGLKFFQTEWDLSVRQAFHTKYDLREPVYNLVQEPRFLPKYEKYPDNQPFNWYLDEYKDIKQTNEEVIKEYIRELSPFEPYPDESKFAKADLKPDLKPRWYRFELKNVVSRKNQYSMIPFKYSREARHKKIMDHLASLPYQTKTA